MRLDALCQLVDWGKHDLDIQSCMMEEFQEVQLFIEDPQHHSAVLTRLSSIARCVWSRNLKLHFTFTRHPELAREFFILETMSLDLPSLKLLRRL